MQSGSPALLRESATTKVVDGRVLLQATLIR